jgi:Fe-S cluster assembly protein SufB
MDEEFLGLSERTVRAISAAKAEPDWMLERRLGAFKAFNALPMPIFGPDLSRLDFNSITYYMRPEKKKARSWDDVPAHIKEAFDKLGVPEAERKFLAGVEAMEQSEAVYSGLKKEWSEQGIIFTDSDSAVREYPEIVKKHFASVVPANDNKFAALNTAVWSGGTFLYVPEKARLEVPVHAYFMISSPAFGQFERTLIIAEKGSKAEYLEGCTAPIYTEESLHAAVVEVIAKENSHVKYTTMQNWSTSVYNLVTKRAFAYENAFVQWLDANIGSGATMKYPSVYLKGDGAKADFYSMACAGRGQNQDTGARAIHEAKNTHSTIRSRGISREGGIATFRGGAEMRGAAQGCTSSVSCEGLILDGESSNLTIPKLKGGAAYGEIAHEARVGRISQDAVFYLMNRGFSESDAVSLIVLGFAEPFMRELPLEYAIEFRRLMALDSGKKVG